MTAPSAVFNISSTIQVEAGIEEYDVSGDVLDGSGLFDGTSFEVGDVVFDSSVLGSFRWIITAITTPSAATPTYRVLWDDEGEHPIPDLGPAAGSGAVCGVPEDGLFGVAQIPALSINEGFGLTEVLYTAIQNSNDRGTDIEAAGISGGGTSLTKSMFNNSGITIPAGTPVAKKSDGGIAKADSDGVGVQQFIGIAVGAILDGAAGSVAIFGSNIAGALTGLGFAPGDDVFLSEGGGYTNDPESFTGGDDSLIQVGIADCAAGVASATVVDLIMLRDRLAAS